MTIKIAQENANSAILYRTTANKKQMTTQQLILFIRYSVPKISLRNLFMA